jgi:ferredoxin
MHYLKEPIFRSERWLHAVASLECVRCEDDSGSQAAHANQGKGMGIKVDDCLSAALCQTCHREIDQGKDMTREQRREAMIDAIIKTWVRLARRGLVKVA